MDPQPSQPHTYAEAQEHRVTLAIIQRDLAEMKSMLATASQRWEEHTRENSASFKAQGERIEALLMRLTVLETKLNPLDVTSRFTFLETRMTDAESKMGIMDSKIGEYDKIKWVLIGSIVAAVVSTLANVMKMVQ